MGSSLFPNYALEKKPYLELKFWKIFKGTNKATGENISAFMFEKKILDKKSEKEKENILLCLRKEPETLIRGKNKHKNFLNVIEPLKEDNYSIGFITEYIAYNLISWINNYHPSKLEIKYIIYQLLSVVIFIHNEYHISHNNLNPDNIFITEKNFIKITGFMFNTSLIKDSNNNNTNNNIIFSKNIVEAYYDLKYIFPELILNNEITNNSDSFIIGLISYYLLGDKSNNDLFILNDNSYDSFKNTYKNTNIDKKINNLSNDELIRDFLKSLLQNNSEKRKNLSQIQNSKFFIDSEDNNKLIPLCLLSNMESTEISKNYDLLKLLPNILNLFSKKEKEFLILPNLLYYLKIENLINPIVPSIFLLSEQNNKEINFEEKVWPTFKKLFNMKKIPAATLYFTLKKISFLINNLSKSEFNKYCIPLICKALDCGVQKIQEVILEELPGVLKNLDKNEFQNSIYNRLVKIVIQTKNKILRKKIMNFFICLTDYFDSYFINNNFLDDIEKIIKSETTLNICKNALILYEKMQQKVNDKSVRSKIIPSLLLMMCNGEISEELFNKGENIIHSYILKIKEKRKEQFVQNIDSDSEEKNKSNNNNNENNNSKSNDKIIKNTKNNNNNINISSPLSISRTKSTLSGNISLFECNSSEDSNFGIDDKNKKAKIDIKIKNDKNKKISNNNSNNNDLFDNLLNDNNEDIYNKNQDSSFDSTSVGKNKNEFNFINRKEFLSSLELKKIEAKKVENNNEIKKLSSFSEKKNNPWEEIESDDENTDELKTYINIKPKKSKEEKNNIKKEKEKSDKKKKWDEDEEEDENVDNLNNKNNENERDLAKENSNKIENNKISHKEEKLEELLVLNIEDEFEQENNNNSLNKMNNNNIYEKDIKTEKNEKNENNDKEKDKDESNKKKIIKKKKKHKKKEKKEKNKDEEIIEEKIEKIKELENKVKNNNNNNNDIDDKKEKKDKNIQKDEKKIEKQISTTKMRMNQRAANIDLDSLLADED